MTNEIDEILSLLGLADEQTEDSTPKNEKTADDLMLELRAMDQDTVVTIASMTGLNILAVGGVRMACLLANLCERVDGRQAKYDAEKE